MIHKTAQVFRCSVCPHRVSLLVGWPSHLIGKILKNERKTKKLNSLQAQEDSHCSAWTIAVSRSGPLARGCYRADSNLKQEILGFRAHCRHETNQPVSNPKWLSERTSPRPPSAQDITSSHHHKTPSDQTVSHMVMCHDLIPFESEDVWRTHVESTRIHVLTFCFWLR